MDCPEGTPAIQPSHPAPHSIPQGRVHTQLLGQPRDSPLPANDHFQTQGPLAPGSKAQVSCCVATGGRSAVTARHVCATGLADHFICALARSCVLPPRQPDVSGTGVSLKPQFPEGPYSLTHSLLFLERCPAQKDSMSALDVCDHSQHSLGPPTTCRDCRGNKTQPPPSHTHRSHCQRGFHSACIAASPGEPLRQADRCWAAPRDSDFVSRGGAQVCVLSRLPVVSQAHQG